MVKIKHQTTGEETEVSRIIDRYSQEQPGPTAIFLCGTHGNETSSVFAIKKIFEHLKSNNIDIKGELVAAFAGNLKALEEGQRYIDNDLNRGWIPERLKKLGFFDDEDELTGHEKQEQRELLDVLYDSVDRAKGEVFIFDLHTTSSASPAFSAISDTIRNRKVAMEYPLPCVVGFDEITRGTFMNYMNELGLCGVAFEAGEHFSLAAIENNISFIWYTLTLLGCIKEEDAPDYNKHYQNLSKANFGKKAIFDLTYHYKISEDDQFRMKPGYTTFDKIEEGEHLADDKNGPVYAQQSGNIFMPLYQKQGDDGYFIVQRKSAEWLNLSEGLRKNRDDKHLTDLPFVDQHPDDDYTILVEKHRIDDIEERLHLMGFRRRKERNGKIMVTRRVYDTESPNLEDLRIRNT